MAPGQTLPLIISLSAEERKITENCAAIQFDLKLTTNDVTLEHNVELRCRKASESFIFTFLDHDGSVQHGAGIITFKFCRRTRFVHENTHMFIVSIVQRYPYKVNILYAILTSAMQIS